MQVATCTSAYLFGSLAMHIHTGKVITLEKRQTFYIVMYIVNKKNKS